MQPKKPGDGALFVEIRVISAKNLVAADSNGFSDPYAILGIGKSKKQKTRVIKKDLNPEWNQKFTFKINDPKELVNIEVYDKDLIGRDDFLGDVQIPLTNLVKSQEKVAWYKLCKTSKGEIQIGITPVNFGIDKIRESPAPPNPRDNVNTPPGGRPGEQTQQGIPIQNPNVNTYSASPNYGQSAPVQNNGYPGSYNPPPNNPNFGSSNAGYPYQYQPQPNVQPLGGYSSFAPPQNTLHPGSIPQGMINQGTMHLQQQQMQQAMMNQQTIHLQQQQQQMLRQGTPPGMQAYAPPGGYPPTGAYPPPSPQMQQYHPYSQPSPQQPQHMQQMPQLQQTQPAHLQQQQQGPPPSPRRAIAQSAPSPDTKKTNKSMVEESASREGYDINYSEIKFIKKIGVGAFGEIWQAEWAGTMAAVKKILKSEIADEDLDEFSKEILLMSKLRHPNIVQFLGACIEPEFCLLTEFMDKGSLFDVLAKNPGLSWQRKVDMCSDIAKGMIYLHTRSPPIIHRDIKSLNILVAKDWKCTISDFGLTRIKDKAMLSTRCGSPAWSAPEILRGEPYNEKADVYSYGVVMWEIITQQPPYKGMNPNQLIGLVAFQKPGLRPPVPQNCPVPGLIDLMIRCWDDDQHKRFYFQEIFENLKEIARQLPH